MFSGRNTQVKYMNSMVIDVLQYCTSHIKVMGLNPVQSLKIFSGIFFQ